MLLIQKKIKTQVFSTKFFLETFWVSSIDPTVLKFFLLEIKWYADMSDDTYILLYILTILVNIISIILFIFINLFYIIM